jgi:putative membrane-bound dehydrogenase-like protein
MAAIHLKLLTGFCVTSLCAPLARPASDGPLSPAEALTAFRLEPGLRVELVAAEPIVVAPVALAFDEMRRLYVVENRGYPMGPGSNSAPAGMITLLEDMDGDGRFEKRTVFAEGLTFPNGVMPWRGGAIVTCAPDVLWLSDTNGDGHADVREVWLTGFDDKNTTQLRVSHPTLGPDGWIYLTSGYTGESTIHSPKFPERPPLKVRTDVRFHPFTGEFESVDGRAQFGQTFDDFGNRFICYNRVHVQHVVGSSRHWKRNPDLNFNATVQNCPESMINDLLSSSENLAARIYPISDNVTTADSHAGTFSAACGVHVYRGNALPGYYGRVFACDPTANLVHWDELVPNGATFLARRSTNHSEFVASRDNWFRPVNLATGPDGALYLCDMYRKTIEHPHYLPEEVRKRTDFESGKDKGRIWRVVAGIEAAKIRQTNRSASDLLPSATAKDLVGLLGHPNGWHRDTAQRLLIERRGTNAVPLLLQQLPKLANESEDALRQMPRAAVDPVGPGPHLTAINALNTLFALSSGRSVASADKAEMTRYFMAMQQNLGLHDANMNSFFSRLVRATLDKSPGVRTTAFRLMDAFPGEGPELGSVFHYLWADDPNPHARFQIALFLGKCEYGETFSALARIARRDGEDRWTRAAVLSGLKGRANHFFDTLLRQTNDLPAPALINELCRQDVNPPEALLALIGVPQRMDGVVEFLSSRDDGWHLAGLAGLLEGLRTRGTTPMPKLADLADKAFGQSQQSLTTPWRADRQSLPALMSRAKLILFDSAQAPVVRSACVTVLAHEQGADAVPTLLRLLAPGQPNELQAAVIRALATLPGDETARELLSPERWQQLSPAGRNIVLNALLAQPRHIKVLLETLEDGGLPLAAIPSAPRNQLVKHKDVAIRQRAERLFKVAGGDRMKIFEEFKSVLELKANPANGRTLFKIHCASCHRLDREGVAVGPDLLGIRNQPKEAILLHVLVPNYEIMPGFAGYQVETTDGRELSGLILSETANSITLRQAQGQDETISRTNIKLLTASRLSLMPEGLEQSLTRQELADLVGYLKGEGN